MCRAAHPSGCARCGAGAGCSAIKKTISLNPTLLLRNDVEKGSTVDPFSFFFFFITLEPRVE